ncbi:nucleoside/nucleotide kinase family protein [Actinopolymorpha singaporensis]|nr:nucleoside/nucleotide kinase family protein [Actinopolymorpha singaporensis]
MAVAQVGAMTYAELLAQARTLASTGRRRVLGIVGAPGAGKSTLAERLVADLAPAAVYVPMDGFHLAQAELDRLGRAGRKGAPDTFDAAGYLALLRRLRDTAEGTVYAPAFSRVLEEPVAGSIPVHPGTPLVVTEGNYLLLTDEPWRQVRALLDACWFVVTEHDVRMDRLIRRHKAFGRSPAVAQAFATGSDQCNADLVAAGITRADQVVDVTAWDLRPRAAGVGQGDGGIDEGEYGEGSA